MKSLIVLGKEKIDEGTLKSMFLEYKRKKNN